MKLMKKTLAVAVLASTPYAASAVELSGNVTMATDYVFRGFSQTNEKFALQGGFDAAFEGGFYLGTWASNVEFGDAAQTELDFYGGYAFDIAEGITLDLGYIYLTYPGNEDDFNYQEFVATVSFSDLSLGVVYSDEYFGEGGPDAYVLNADYSLSVSEEMSVDFHIGYSDADAEDFFGEDDSYVDYMIGGNYDIEGVTLTLAWYGTDVDDIDVADDRIVFAVSKSL